MRNKMKKDMEIEAGRPLTFMEDGLITLLEDIMPAQEIKTEKRIAPEIEFLKIDPIEVRIEALKLAYDIAYKVGNFSRSYEPGGSRFKEDIDDVFQLADMNINYIMNNARLNKGE